MLRAPTALIRGYTRSVWRIKYVTMLLFIHDFHEELLDLEYSQISARPPAITPMSIQVTFA